MALLQTDLRTRLCDTNLAMREGDYDAADEATDGALCELMMLMEYGRGPGMVAAYSAARTAPQNALARALVRAAWELNALGWEPE